MQVSGFIAAGGRSSRMGVNKALLSFGRQTMIERVIGVLRQVTDRVAIIAAAGQFERFGLPVYPDEKQGVGPLEAIRTALAHCDTDYALILACDLPFVTGELLNFLVTRADGYDATVPAGEDGRLEPLCAVYSREIIDRVTSLIDDGERKVSRLLEAVRTRLIGVTEFSHLKGAFLFFENVNTPEDYERAIEHLERVKSELI